MTNICTVRLFKEQKSIVLNPIDGIAITPANDNDITNSWTACVDGPKDTPYEGGKFHINVEFPKEYPFRPPKLLFLTKIFHPNISAAGICLDILRDKWAASLTVQTVLLSVVSLISSPNPDDPLVPEAATLFRNDRQKYNDIVKTWVSEFAHEHQTFEL